MEVETYFNRVPTLPLGTPSERYIDIMCLGMREVGMSAAIVEGIRSSTPTVPRKHPSTFTTWSRAAAPWRTYSSAEEVIILPFSTLSR